MHESELEFMSDMWTTDKDNWVLVRIPDDPNDLGAQAVWKYARKRMAVLGMEDQEPLVYSIYNAIDGSTVLLNDDRFIQEVLRNMLEAGVQVVDEPPEPLPEDSPERVIYTRRRQERYQEWYRRYIQGVAGA